MLRNSLYVPRFADNDAWGFEIIEGDYKGAVVKINSIEFSETDSEKVELDYTLLNASDLTESDKTYADDPVFIAVVETIINDVLREAIQDYEQNRNDSSQEPSSQ